MKQKLCIFYCLVLLYWQMPTHAQVEYVPNQLMVMVANETAIPTVTEDEFGNKHYQFGNPILNTLFEQYDLQSYEPTYTGLERIRHQHVATLKKVYTITCDCKAADLHFALERDVGQLFTFIEHIEEIQLTFSSECESEAAPTCTYLPNDYGFGGVPNGVGDFEETELRCAWDITTGDPNIIVAINDSRIEIHDDFKDPVGGLEKLVWAEAQFVDCCQPQGTPPSGPNCTNGGPGPGSTNPSQHATKVAGIAIANGNNSPNGMAGVAHNCRFMFHNIGYDSMIDAADRGASVINCSWVGCTHLNIRQLIVDMVTDMGVTIVAASGNGNCEGTDDVNDDEGGNVPPVSDNENFHNFAYPASYDNVISVTTVDQRDMYATTSEECNGCQPSVHTHNTAVDISAPGFCVRTIKGCNQPHIGRGTSAAAPFVSGTVALMLSVNPCLSPADVEMILEQTADDVNCLTHDNPCAPVFDNADYAGTSGAGRVNVHDAVVMAQNFTPNLPSFTIANGQDITWDDSQVHSAASITVESGGKLTLLNTTLRMREDAVITVERGGTFIVDNSLITNACASRMWGGISVWGTSILAHPTDPIDVSNNATIQAPVAHGLVVVKNNSILTNAATAIFTKRLWGYFPDHYGGIVIAHDSEFLNNRKDIGFMQFPDPYAFYISQDNASELVRCTFNKEMPPFGGGNILQGVSMWDTHGIVFDECTFIANPDAFPLDDPNYEIWGINTEYADFEVRNQSLFRFLDKGIFLQTSPGEDANVTVTGSTFRENAIGLYSEGGHFLNISQENTFFENYYSTGGNDIGSGIRLSPEDVYRIEDNTFMESYQAIVLQETGNQANLITRNIFVNGFQGLLPMGDNRELHITCNNFLGTNQFNWTLVSFWNDGQIREWQGIIPIINPAGTDPASNKFVDPPCGNGDNHSHIYTDLNTVSFNYVHHDVDSDPNLDPRYEPTCFNPQINNDPDPGDTPNYAHFTPIALEGAGQNFDCFPTTGKQAYSYQPSLSSPTLEDIAILDGLIADMEAMLALEGDAPALLSTLTDLHYRRNQAFNALYQHYLANNDWEGALSFLAEENSLVAQKKRVNVYLRLKDYAAVEAELTKMLDSPEDNRHYKALIRLRVDLELAGKTYSEMEAEQETLVRGIATLPTPSSVYAKGILGFAFQEYFAVEHPDILIPHTAPAKQETLTNPSYLSSIPNPADAEVLVQVDYPIMDGQKAVLKLYNLTGQVLETHILNKGQQKVLLTTQDWQEGMYFCQLWIEGQAIGLHKILVVH